MRSERGRFGIGAAGALALLVLAPVVALGAAGDFAQPSTSPESAGHTGHGIVSGDFNEDLKDDLAIANSGGNDVTILLGDGAGNFTAAASSPEAVPGASDVAAGDLDNDGDEDLAVAGTEVYILLNDGLGTGNFAAPLTENLDNTAVSGNANSIGIAQMNGDTDLDVVAGQFFHPRVTVLINDGNDDGAFTALPFENAAENGMGNSDNLANIALAPIDNTFNSVADVMIARQFTGTVRTMANANGAGDLAFQSTQITLGGGNADDVALGQFGSNAFNDVAVANAEANTVSILIGAGDGGFTEAGTSPEAVPGGSTGNGPRSITTGEFNGDANLDLAMGAGFNGASSRVVVMLGNGAGNFTPTAGSPINVGSNIPNGIATGDFNGGNLDFAITNFFPLPNTAVNILLNDFTPPTTGGGGGGTTTTPPLTTTPAPTTTPPKKKCKKGLVKRKGKCVKKGKK